MLLLWFILTVIIGTYGVIQYIIDLIKRREPTTKPIVIYVIVIILIKVVLEIIT